MVWFLAIQNWRTECHRHICFFIITNLIIRGHITVIILSYGNNINTNCGFNQNNYLITMFMSVPTRFRHGQTFSNSMKTNWRWDNCCQMPISVHITSVQIKLMTVLVLCIPRRGIIAFLFPSIAHIHEFVCHQNAGRWKFKNAVLQQPFIYNIVW